MRTRILILTLCLVVSCLFGCDSAPDYIDGRPASRRAYEREPIAPKPQALYDKLSSLHSAISDFGFKNIALGSDIMDLRGGLAERYTDVAGSRDIAVVHTEGLKQIKQKYSSLEVALRDITGRLDAIELEMRSDEQNSSSWYGGTAEKFEGLADLIASHRQYMADNRDRIADLENQIAAFNERYAVDRERYILKKNRYREHLLKGLAANGISEDHIYISRASFGDELLIYVDSIRVTKDSITACLKAYLIMPRWRWHSSISTNNCHSIFAYNARDENLGSPIDVRSTVHKESNGVTVALTYQDDVPLGLGHVKLVLFKHVFETANEVTFVIPYNRREVSPPTLPEPIAKGPMAKTERDFVEQIKTIACKKEGDHLVVPVTLDIHGKSVEAAMMLDTGASMTTVPMKLYLRGNAKPLSTLRREKFVTASRVIESYIDEIAVATSAYSKTSSVAISDYDLPLLGANYFQGNVFTVDVENECIYVHPR